MNCFDFRGKFPFSIVRQFFFISIYYAIFLCVFFFALSFSPSSFSIEIVYLECSRNAVLKATIGIEYNYVRFKTNATVSINSDEKE